jgi:glutathione peroxidase
MSLLYTFSAKTLSGDTFAFESLRGKVVLIVNTASKCGFTPQYKGLQKLYEQYQEKGLVILGFPSNDFLFQEPGSHEEIQSFCSLNYGVTFPMFEKIHVRGKKAHPLFAYLITGAGNDKLKGSILWNFNKFLLDGEGNIVERFGSMVSPSAIEEKIRGLLS